MTFPFSEIYPFICGPGQKTLLTWCFPCDMGTYRSDVSHTFATCRPCSPGSYAASTGRSHCDACSPGSFSLAGASSCILCSAGWYSAQGASSCSLCDIGHFCVGGVDKTPCSAGWHSLAGASSCSLCSAGWYSGAGASSCAVCDIGHFCVGGTDKIPCPVNTYADQTGTYIDLRGNVRENRRGAPTCRHNLCSYCDLIDSFITQTLSIHCILKFFDLSGFVRHYLLR